MFFFVRVEQVTCTEVDTFTEVVRRMSEHAPRMPICIARAQSASRGDVLIQVWGQPGEWTERLAETPRRDPSSHHLTMMACGRSGCQTRLMDLSHPPLDFPIYGLAAGEWDPPRWLDHMEGPLGWRAEGVWLRHGSPLVHDAQEPWLRVATFRRDRYEHKPDPLTTPSDVAQRASFTLLDLTAPEPSRTPEGYADRIIDAARALGDRHPEWPQVTWTLDGDPVSASVVSFAGAWAGFTRAVPDADIVVVGCGIEPNG